MRVTAVLTVRNEGAFLLEWLAHHRAVGVTDFVVFSNDCADGTDRMLDRLAKLGWLIHCPNPGPYSEGPQWAALKQADRLAAVRQADWLLSIDIDEFINVRVGTHRLADLFAALPLASAITLSWRLFGNPGIASCDDHLITRTFTHAAPRRLFWPWRAAMFKTLFRNDGGYRKLGVHRPRSPDPARLPHQQWFDGSGSPLPRALAKAGVFLDPSVDRYAMVQLNHYALGTYENFILKADRGNSFDNGDALDMNYWVERNFTQDEDASILDLDSRALRADLMADRELSDLHSGAVAWRKGRFRSLMADERWRGLYGRLLLTPPSRVLDRDTARTIWEHRGTDAPENA